MKEAVSADASAVIYPGEAGAGGRDVYSTIFLGANAYGVTEVEGGGLRHIVKPLGSGGTADPLGPAQHRWLEGHQDRGGFDRRFHGAGRDCQYL